MGAARLATQYEKLGQFEGVFEAEELLAPSPWAEAGVAKSRAIYRRGIGGAVVVQDSVQERDGRTVFESHDVFTVDPSEGSTLWYLFDSFGYPPLEPARGVWEDDTLLLTERDARGGATRLPFQGRLSLPDREQASR